MTGGASKSQSEPDVANIDGRFRHSRTSSEWEIQMTINSKYIFIASMDVDPDKEDLFNEVYDTEHIPNLLKVPGVRSATRTKGEAFEVSIGGVTRTVAHEGARYSAVYEIDGPHVLVSEDWAKAGEAGRWSSEVRPYTRNRQHALYKVV